jgi:hypothetical protein
LDVDGVDEILGLGLGEELAFEDLNKKEEKPAKTVTFDQLEKDDSLDEGDFDDALMDEKDDLDEDDSDDGTDLMDDNSTEDNFDSEDDENDDLTEINEAIFGESSDEEYNLDDSGPLQPQEIDRRDINLVTNFIGSNVLENGLSDSNFCKERL